MSSFDGFIRADKVNLEPTRYIFHDRFLCGAINTVGGKSRKGKSLLSNLIAIELSQKGMHVIINNPEEANSIIRARLEAGGADLKFIHFPERDYHFPTDVLRLQDDVERTGAAVVIFDTAAKCIEAPMGNDQKVAQCLDPVAKIAQRTGAMLLFITHTLKSAKKGGDPLDAIGGSTGGLVGTSRVVAIFGGVEMGEGIDFRSACWVKDSYRAVPPPMLFSIDSETVFDPVTNVEVNAGFLTVEDDALAVGDNDAWATQLVTGKAEREGGSARNSEKRDDAAAWLRDALSFGCMDVNDVKQAAADNGQAWGTVRRAKDEIGVEIAHEGAKEKKKTYWQLPVGHPALAPNAERKATKAEKDAAKAEKKNGNGAPKGGE